MKKILFVLMFLPSIAFATRWRNVFVKGQNLYNQNYDFNARYNIPAGDTVVIPGGNYGDVDFKLLRGITFVNEDTGGVAYLKSFTGYPGMGYDVTLDGSMNPAHKYGIVIQGTKFGFNVSLTGWIKMNAVEILGNSTGVKIVQDTVTVHARNYCNVQITNSHIRGNKLEGMYLGASNSVGVYMNGLVSNNRVDSTGWDAIQCRVGYFVIEDNVCDSIGLTKEAGQNHGILIGSNTNGSIIRRNKVTNVTGYGIFNNGFGTQIIECNDVSTSMMIQSLERRTDFQNVGKKDFIVRGNIIRGTGITLYAYINRTQGVPMTVQYINNQTPGTPSVQAGIIYTASDNTPTTVPVCGSPSPGKTIWKVIKLYTDGTYSEI